MRLWQQLARAWPQPLLPSDAPTTGLGAHAGVHAMAMELLAELAPHMKAAQGNLHFAGAQQHSVQCGSQDHSALCCHLRACILRSGSVLSCMRMRSEVGYYPCANRAGEGSKGSAGYSDDCSAARHQECMQHQQLSPCFASDWQAASSISGTAAEVSRSSRA